VKAQERSKRSSRRDLWALWESLKKAPRVVILALFILGVFALFGRQLWILQFARGEYYRDLANRQSTSPRDIPAPRGIIYDRNADPLVRNEPSFYVTIVPAHLPDDEEEAQQVLVRLAVLLDMPYTTGNNDASEADPDAQSMGVREIVEDVPYIAPYRPLVIKRGVDREKALMVAQESASLPGVSVETESIRRYPYGARLSHILGYLLPIPGKLEEEYRAEGYDPATDRVGSAGIEATYEDNLRGTKGEQLVEEDVLGRVIRVVEERAAPVPGDNVYLTLDLELQQVVEEALAKQMSQPDVSSPRGVSIVMNPQTGEILAMVSLPTYDNNLFSGGISARDWERLQEDIHRPLMNHAISGGVPPGSVFKTVMAAAVLQEGIVTPQTQLNCPGKIVVANKYYPNDPGLAQPFYCWNEAGHGWTDIFDAIAHSCSIYFYKVGGGFEETDFDGLGVSRIAEYAEMFGLGEPTGVELPVEIGGLVPTADWKRRAYGESWSTGDTYNLSIGQGFLSVTPLQMLNAVNAIANNGTLYRPTIVHHVTDPQGNTIEPFESDVIRQLDIDPEYLDIVRRGMEGTVDYGSAAKRGQIEGVRVAGKTGTAQFCDDIMCGVGFEQPEHAWFAAFAPMENPEVSVIVFIYNGGEGSVTAVPVAQEILEYYFGLNENGDAENGTDQEAVQGEQVRRLD
jgi:penicillin-binding protein 2